MTDLLIAPWVRISGGRYDFLSNTAAASSPFTGAIRSVARTGDRVSVKISTENASRREDEPTRAFLSALRPWLRGQANRVWYTDPGYTMRGSFPASELISNNTFASGITGWNQSNVNISLAASDRVLRSTRLNLTGATSIRAPSFTTVSGAAYIARVMAITGRGAMNYGLRLGTSAGATDVASSSGLSSAGIQTLVGTASGTTTHFSILDSTSGRAIDDYMDFMYVSVSRCALIAGASQTGASLNIDALPASTSGLALYGDWCQVGNQLCMIVQSLDSDSSGAGVLHLAYPPRSTPADNAPVILHQPMGRFVAMSNEGGYDFMPGGFSNHSFDLVEALDS